MEKEHSYTYKDHNANGCKVQGWTWRNIGQPFLIWFLTEELREQQYGGFVGFEMCVCVFFFQTSLSPFLTLGPMFYQTNSAFSLSLSPPLAFSPWELSFVKGWRYDHAPLSLQSPSLYLSLSLSVSEELCLQCDSHYSNPWGFKYSIQGGFLGICKMTLQFHIMTFYLAIDFILKPKAVTNIYLYLIQYTTCTFKTDFLKN